MKNLPYAFAFLCEAFITERSTVPHTTLRNRTRNGGLTADRVFNDPSLTRDISISDVPVRSTLDHWTLSTTDQQSYSVAFTSSTLTWPLVTPGSRVLNSRRRLCRDETWTGACNDVTSGFGDKLKCDVVVAPYFIMSFSTRRHYSSSSSSLMPSARPAAAIRGFCKLRSNHNPSENALLSPVAPRHDTLLITMVIGWEWRVEENNRQCRIKLLTGQILVDGEQWITVVVWWETDSYCVRLNRVYSSFDDILNNQRNLSTEVH